MKIKNWEIYSRDAITKEEGWISFDDFLKEFWSVIKMKHPKKRGKMK